MIRVAACRIGSSEGISQRLGNGATDFDTVSESNGAADYRKLKRTQLHFATEEFSKSAAPVMMNTGFQKLREQPGHSDVYFQLNGTEFETSNMSIRASERWNSFNGY